MQEGFHCSIDFAKLLWTWSQRCKNCTTGAPDFMRLPAMGAVFTVPVFALLEHAPELLSLCFFRLTPGGRAPLEHLNIRPAKLALDHSQSVPRSTKNVLKPCLQLCKPNLRQDSSITPPHGSRLPSHSRSRSSSRGGSTVRIFCMGSISMSFSTQLCFPPERWHLHETPASREAFPESKSTLTTRG